MSRDIRTSDPGRMLIVLPNWVGDLVLATCALRGIRDRFPTTHIAVLVKPALRELLSGNTWADEVVLWPGGKTRPSRRQGFLGLAQELKRMDFDTAVLLTNSFRSALLTRLAGIGRRVGYDREGRGMLLTDRLLADRRNGRYVPVSMVHYYNAIARYLGARDVPTIPELATTPDDEAAADGVRQRFGVRPGRPVVVVNPGASFGSAKCWLPGRFGEVADGLIEQFEAAVFVTCGPQERDIAQAVRDSMRHEAIVLDQPVLGLGALKALVRGADLMITNDTGPRHFAVAFGVPAVTLFGSTDPAWTATSYERETRLMVKVNCGPCMKRVCPLDHRCMRRITSSMVLDAASAMLGGRRAGRDTATGAVEVA